MNKRRYQAELRPKRSRDRSVTPSTAQVGRPRPSARGSRALLRELESAEALLASTEPDDPNAGERWNAFDNVVRRVAGLSLTSPARNAVRRELKRVDAALRGVALTPSELHTFINTKDGHLTSRKALILWRLLGRRHRAMRLAASVGLKDDQAVKRWRHYRRIFGNRDALRRLADADGPLGWERGVQRPVRIRTLPFEAEVRELAKQGLSCRAVHRELVKAGALRVRRSGREKAMSWEGFRKRFGHLWGVPEVLHDSRLLRLRSIQISWPGETSWVEVVHLGGRVRSGDLRLKFNIAHPDSPGSSPLK
jgi:hypothetical protein